MSEKVALIIPAGPSSSFSQGGAEAFYDGLEQALLRKGHEVERIPLEFDERRWENILPAYKKAYRLDLSRFDWVISTKAPTHLVQHPRHVCYLLHTMRVFYDRWEGGDEKQRQLIQRLDREAFDAIPAHRRFCIGQTVAQRMKDHIGINFEVLYPVPPERPWRCESYEDFFTCSRLHPWKRIDLLIEAMKFYGGNRRLLIAGQGSDRARLEKLAAGDDRILFLGFVDEEQLMDLYARARAVPFVPVEEDFGYVAAEAGLASKPVITCTDSGEPVRWVEHWHTGLIVEPLPEKIAWAFEQLDADDEKVTALGQAGKTKAETLNWDAVVDTLYQASGQEPAGEPEPRKMVPGRRAKILCTDNQILLPAIGGGRVRNYYLLKSLAEHFDIVYVGTWDWGGPDCTYQEEELAPGFRAVIVPATLKHLVHSDRLKAKAGEIVYDVAFPEQARHTPRFARVLQREAADCDLMISTHPWAWPLLPKESGKPLVYDAHNCEYDIKKQIFGSGWRPLRRRLLAGVETTERSLCQTAQRVWVCSQADGERFQELYGVNPGSIDLVPNGVAVDEVTPLREEDKPALRRSLGLPEGPLVIFMGSGYLPNTEAVEWIASEMAPVMPQVTFLIVGSVCDTFKDVVNRRVASAGKVKTIFAESPIPDNLRLWGIASDRDKAALLACASLALNPMFHGSGSNMKMLDFLAAGLPLISTRVGARGLQVTGGEHLLIAESENIISAARQLLENPEQGRQLGQNGRKLVEQVYAWPVIAGAAAQSVEDILREAGS